MVLNCGNVLFCCIFKFSWRQNDLSSNFTGQTKFSIDAPFNALLYTERSEIEKRILKSFFYLVLEALKDFVSFQWSFIKYDIDPSVPFSVCNRSSYTGKHTFIKNRIRKIVSLALQTQSHTHTDIHTYTPLTWKTHYWLFMTLNSPLCFCF